MTCNLSATTLHDKNIEILLILIGYINLAIIYSHVNGYRVVGEKKIEGHSRKGNVLTQCLRVSV